MPTMMAHIACVQQDLHMGISEGFAQLRIIHRMCVAQHSNNHIYGLFIHEQGGEPFATSSPIICKWAS